MRGLPWWPWQDRHGGYQPILEPGKDSRAPPTYSPGWAAGEPMPPGASALIKSDLDIPMPPGVVPSAVRQQAADARLRHLAQVVDEQHRQIIFWQSRCRVLMDQLRAVGRP